MAIMTLAEAVKTAQNDLVAGVIENIVDVNPIYQVMPFQPINGNALSYNRESVLGDAEILAEGGTITAKAGPEYTNHTATLSTIIGDAEVNGMRVAQGVGGPDHVAQQIASKAKSVGRKFQGKMITGDKGSTAAEFDGLIQIATDASQTIDAAGALSFDLLDQLLMSVKSKDGEVDYIMANEREIRKIRSLSRALGGTDAEYVSMNGVRVLHYAGVPVFRNDFIPIATGASTVFAGNFDDGSQKVGLAGLTGSSNAGIVVENVGAKETMDETIYRVKFYSSLAVYSGLGIAALTGVTA